MEKDEVLRQILKKEKHENYKNEQIDFSGN